MDYAKALTFQWEDPRWKEKIAMGTVVALVSGMLMPILVGIVGIFIILGYCIRVTENVRDGSTYPLPEWDQWSADLTRGFKLFVVTLVWGLPFILVGLPIAFGGIMLGVGSDENSIGPLGALGGLTMGFGYCLIFIYGIIYAVMTPGFTVWYARNEQISDGFKVTEIWHWTRSNLGNVILVMVAVAVASMIISAAASVVGMLLCFIGLLVTIPLSVLVTYLYQYNLIGQLAYKERTGQPYYVPAAPIMPAAPPYQAPGTPPAPPVPPVDPAQPERPLQ